MEVPWSSGEGHVRVLLRATPRGGRDAIDGIADLADGRRALKARVTVAAEDGKANAALARLLAAAAGVPASAVELVSGATGRLKTFRVSGDAGAIVRRLEALVGAG